MFTEADVSILSDYVIVETLRKAVLFLLQMNKCLLVVKYM